MLQLQLIVKQLHFGRRTVVSAAIIYLESNMGGEYFSFVSDLRHFAEDGR